MARRESSRRMRAFVQRTFYTGGVSSVPPARSSRVTLLGIPIDPVTMDEAVLLLRAALSVTKQHHVMTPNSEMLVEAQGNPRFRAVLHRSSLNLPDSRGLLWAARRTGQRLPERVTGVDTVEKLCRLLDGNHPVFLLGGKEGVAEKAAAVLKSRNAQLNIVGTFAGSPRKDDAAMLINLINETKPHLLLVAYGAPAQDLWIADSLQELKTVRVAMGVGGTFDFLAGVHTRAPIWMQRAGLEWLWRLIQQPSRWRRIWRAVVVFPWAVVRGH